MSKAKHETVEQRENRLQRSREAGKRYRAKEPREKREARLVELRVRTLIQRAIDPEYANARGRRTSWLWRDGHPGAASAATLRWRAKPGNRERWNATRRV
jgi:hypothetical protein